MSRGISHANISFLDYIIAVCRMDEWVENVSVNDLT
jgi:hypothetical protein